MTQILSIVIQGAIIVNLGQMVTRVQIQKHLYEIFLVIQFKQENVFTLIYINGINDGSHTPALSSQEKSSSNMRMDQTVNL